jgi:hypothetical protein
VAPIAVALNTEGRRKAVKFRPGGEKVVSRVAQLSTMYALPESEQLSKRMDEKLQLASQLAPLHTLLDSLTQRVSDTMLVAKSDCWQSTLVRYGMLEMLARVKPEIQRELQPVQEFMAVGKRKAKVSPAPAKEQRSVQ